MTTTSRGRRLKFAVIAVLLVAAALALTAATQTWFTLTLRASGARLPVSGAVAAPALSALAFAGIALAAALAIAGPVIRLVLGALGIVLGGAIVLAAGLALSDAVAAGAPAVTSSTGVSGQDSVHALVSAVATTPWPVLAIVAGVLVALGGLAVLLTARLWPASSRRYQAVRLEAADGTGRAPDAVDEWDELSRGDDPTAR
ncbi:Trp biosynthesis-associated membrane protein [Rathayibacter sp. YIM 133350]|uniref:Trp biosynthesis-associated membrane protein n=1 Tax=Rathayibacter sp. YIM 133350 TaxID=3131992 RepID=UPI00307F47A7